MISALVGLLLVTARSPRLAAAQRTDQAGWIYVRLAGSPRDIGFQYGTLAAPEIADAHRALKAELKQNTGRDWSFFRTTAKRLFWNHLDKEYQDELSGQAEGLVSQHIPVDVWDVLAFNSYIEIEGYYLPWVSGQPVSGANESCSAFVATGSQTADGGIVMGHNLWWDYVMGQRFNLILDITPQRGNRVVMDALCGFIHSGSDFAINSSGIEVCETTISGFMGFDPAGKPEFMRMRKAIQYSNNLNEFAATMRDGNNGGYANTWLLGDNKTGEIGKLELGLKNVTFQSRRDGSYVGSNFPENPKLIQEEIVGGWDSDPKSNSCERRRVRWNTLLKQNPNRVDAELAKTFLADTFDEVLSKHGASDSTLCGRRDLGPSPSLHGAVNTKVVTQDLAKRMTFWARMGFSDGSAFKASDYWLRSSADSALKSFLKDIPSQPWILVPPAR